MLKLLIPISRIIFLTCRYLIVISLIWQIQNWNNSRAYAFQQFEEKENLPDWQILYSLGFGNALYMNQHHPNLLQSSLTFLFYPIHNFNKLEAKVKIMTQSPTREEDGFIEIPLRDYDFSQVSEIWLKYQIFSQLQFKFGRFPDEIDELTPKSWPYQSVFTKIDLVETKPFSLNFLARHDLLSVYSSRSNKSTSTDIERTRVEGDLNYRYDFENFLLSVSMRTFYDYFSDPDYTLSSLTFGREQYIENPVTNYDQQYRLLTYSGSLSLGNNFFQTNINAKYWNNLISANYSFGKMFGFEQNFKFGQLNLLLAFYKFFAEQNSVPPSAISANYFPGFQISSFHTGLSYKFNEQIKTFIDYRYESADVYGQSNIRGMNPGSTPNIPKYKIIFAFEYLITANTPKDILTRQ
ncbi:hypothetical protein QEJ31_02310 [Pigmentibacter sp. JX0631]|uniref:hypothetical protein n=1 Tax=Pigmentibacter sp. JX0631 TaxID=2976982 RepID=UPI00246919B5|nr:hypothetical protein [Pigmentibacter sp. JX0631]WGL60437.1 hypothetical protein QEJ31_02310 [Pigmentibacter sp. JX0631]